MGFNNKSNVKRLLEKCFSVDIDYKLLLPPAKQTTHIKGGHNKDYITSVYPQVKQSTHTKGGHNKEINRFCYNKSKQRKSKVVTIKI